MTSTAAPDVVATTDVRATPDAVWRAITETDFTLRYFYGNAVESDWQPGSPYRMTVDGVVQIEGLVLEADPPRRLIQSWHGVWDPGMAADPPTRVTWEIDEEPPGISRVTLIHGGLAAGSATLAQVTDGWPFILSAMKTLLETGQGMEER